MLTRLALIQALQTTTDGNGIIADDTPVEAIVYNSEDGGMLMVDYPRNEYDQLEFLMAEPFTNQAGVHCVQLVFQLKPGQHCKV